MTTTKARAFDANEGPGLARLRKAANAEAIREAVLADQRKALAKKAPPASRIAPPAAKCAPEAHGLGPFPAPIGPPAPKAASDRPRGPSAAIRNRAFNPAGKDSAMRPPEHYSVAPLPSIATRIPGLPKPLPFHQQAANILAWLRGHRDPAERSLEDRIVAALVREVETDDEGYRRAAEHCEQIKPERL
jgi:hypothetical protein